MVRCLRRPVNPRWGSRLSPLDWPRRLRHASIRSAMPTSPQAEAVLRLDLSLLVSPVAAASGACPLKPLPHLICASREMPEAGIEALGKLEQVEVGGVSLPPANFADLFSGEPAAGCGDIILLEQRLGLAHEQRRGLRESGVIRREGLGLSLTWHGRELYASGQHAERPYIGYTACRQSSEPHFPRFL